MIVDCGSAKGDVIRRFICSVVLSRGSMRIVPRDAKATRLPSRVQLAEASRACTSD